MEPTPDTSHVTEGLALRISQWLNKPNFQAVLTGFLNEVQTVENVLWDVIHSQRVSRIVPPGPPDQALLQLADLVGCPTAGLDGPQLSLFLGIWQLARRSKGLSDDLIRILLAAFPGGFEYDEYWPVALEAWVPALSDDSFVIPVSKALRIARPPAVSGVLAWGTWPTATLFFGDSTSGGVTGSGFDDSTASSNAQGFLSAIQV